MCPKILQFCLINTSDVPRNYMQMLRERGFDCRMVAMRPSPNHYPEDICLHWPKGDNRFLQWWRGRKAKKSPRLSDNVERLRKGGEAREFPPVFHYANFTEKAILQFRDIFWRKRAVREITKWELNSYDIYHFHDGLEFTRSGKWVKELSRKGKKIVCHYHGVDLRERGVVPAVDRLSQLNITNEFDLLSLHPNIHHIPIPFRFEEYPLHEEENKRLLILHTPSTVAYKGTEKIEAVLKKVASERQVDFEILWGRPHREVIGKKMHADLAVEQIGNLGGTGYGVNSLENLSMGVPTITEFIPAYENFLGPHPFALACEENLYRVLVELIDNPIRRKALKTEGRKWVEKNHSYKAVFERLKELYRENGIGEL